MIRRRAGWPELAACALLWWFATIGTASAQKLTEQFIPIGRSPGISQKYTSIGMIESMNQREGLFAMSESGVRRIVKLTPRTHIWLDRSSLKLPNLEGTAADLQSGRRVEVKFENPVLRQVADWVKVEITRN